MNWMDEVSARLKRHNQVLFARDSEFLRDLDLLLRAQSHITLTLWAFDLAGESVAALEEKYPRERRPREALVAAQDWAAGRIKMPLAQRKILDCHALAKELTEKADTAACHAVGQACAVVHTAGHALGYPIYDLSRLIYELGPEHCREAVEERRQAYLDKLFYWGAHGSHPGREWAPFMQR